MQKKTADFARSLGLCLKDGQLTQLAAYVELVWQKKDFLNLTSVADKNKIFTRHICDGLAFAAFCQKKGEKLSLADMGSGAGYIGLSTAIALPSCHMTLVESLEKRCSFLNWVILKLGLKNVTVKCMRLGQGASLDFDCVTERAMGQMNDILPLIAPAVRPGGYFAAYQSHTGEADVALCTRLRLTEQESVSYTLPGEDKKRFLAVFLKAEN